MDKPQSQPIITTQELAERANVSDRYIRYALGRGEIPGAYKAGGTWIVPRSAGERWLEQRKESA